MATLLLASGAAAQEVPHFELDVIFPRNETYLPAETFPIAVAIQNLTALRTLGDFEVAWDIMPYANGLVPGGITYDMGVFEMLEDGGDGTSIFVGNSNVTGWIDEKRQRGEQYGLNWHVVWRRLKERCGIENTNVFGHIIFDVQTEWERRETREKVELGLTPDVKEAPECPVFGTVVEIRPPVGNSSCETVVDGDTGREGEPCAVRVDRELASSIESWAASIATSTPSPTSLDSDEGEGEGEGEDDEEDAAPGAIAPARISVAIACVVGYLAFAL